MSTLDDELGLLLVDKHGIDRKMDNIKLMRIAGDLMKVHKLISKLDDTDDGLEACSLLCDCIYGLDAIIKKDWN